VGTGIGQPMQKGVTPSAVVVDAENVIFLLVGVHPARTTSHQNPIFQGDNRQTNSTTNICKKLGYRWQTTRRV